MARGIIKGERLAIHVGDHQHQLKNYQLTLDLNSSLDVISVGIEGTTYSEIPTHLTMRLDKQDSKRLLRLLENRIAKMR